MRCRVALGRHESPFRETIFEGAARGLSLDFAKSAVQKMRLKEWTHFAVVTPQHLVTFAIVDLKFLKLAWCQVVDRSTGARFEHSRRGVSSDAAVSPHLFGTRSWFIERGFRVQVDSDLERGRHELEVEIEATGTAPRVRLDARAQASVDRFPPLVVVLPVGPDAVMHSNKAVMPASGRLTLGDRSHSLEEASSFAILDHHRAQYPRHTWWKWATFAGRDPAGRLIGINLTQNLVADDARYNENAIWIDNRLHSLGPARFEIQEAERRPWRIATSDGAVQLAFTPEGARREDLSLGVLVSRFTQCYGRFDGTVRAAGELVSIDGFYGLAEDHDSVW